MTLRNESLTFGRWIGCTVPSVDGSTKFLARAFTEGSDEMTSSSMTPFSIVPFCGIWKKIQKHFQGDQIYRLTDNYSHHIIFTLQNYRLNGCSFLHFKCWRKYWLWFGCKKIQSFLWQRPRRSSSTVKRLWFLLTSCFLFLFRFLQFIQLLDSKELIQILMQCVTVNGSRRWCGSGSDRNTTRSNDITSQISCLVLT